MNDDNLFSLFRVHSSHKWFSERPCRKLFTFVYFLNALKRAGPPRRASKSKLRTHDKGSLDQHFLDSFSFHFTSSGCLCVGYKMKTCTQISDSGFRRKINVVSPGDSAKRASPGRRAGFSHVNAR